MRFFNTAGPIIQTDHYYVSQRLNIKEITNLIEEKKYFILHAPRQTGKTTAIRLLVDQLNDERKYRAFYINVESAQVARGNVHEGIKAIINLVIYSLEDIGMSDEIIELVKKQKEESFTGLFRVLELWSLHTDMPIVLFIDEIDSLVGDTLISVLRQLRTGYVNRPHKFPQSICLIGVRDVRDYRIWSEEQQSMVLGGSAFNIKAESLTLSNFSQEEVRLLLLQHTNETGQVFTDEAIEYVFYLTQGQPWLVNALAYQACFRDVVDRSLPITQEIIERSKEQLILRRDTHINTLVNRLRESQVLHVINAIISGAGQEDDFKIDDLSYVRYLGLVTQKGIAIANPIYKEIISHL